MFAKRLQINRKCDNVLFDIIFRANIKSSEEIEQTRYNGRNEPLGAA